MNEVTVRPVGSLAITYDGPLNAEQAGSIRRRLAEALPGVEIIVTIAGQDPTPAVTQARAILAGIGVTEALAASMTTAMEQTGRDPVEFARYFVRVHEAGRGHEAGTVAS
jgi:hypothetical protein